MNTIEPGFMIGQPFEIDLPAIDLFPHKIWSRLAANRCATGLHELLRCADTGGYLPLRQAIAEHVRETRGMECEPDQVIVVSGQGQAISLASTFLIETGDVVLIEDPTHIGLRQILSAAGARLVPVPVDGEGFDLAAAGAIASEARFALVTPSRHFPLGVAMGPGRRAALGAWARAGDRWIFEDDTGHDLTASGSWQPPLASSAASPVLYFSSFRPTLAPSLRLGFLIVPETLVDAMRAVRMLVDGYRPPLEQAILADFIASGGYARHVRDMRQAYAERHAALVDAVAEHLSDAVLPSPTPAGLHTVCRLRPSLQDAEIATRAERGFVVRPLSAFYDGPTEANALLLGHAPMNPAEIRREVGRFAVALR